MNKEALRKELEDAWKDGFNSSCDVMNSYITTRLAALDDGQEGKGLEAVFKALEDIITYDQIDVPQLPVILRSNAIKALSKYKLALPVGRKINARIVAHQLKTLPMVL